MDGTLVDTEPYWISAEIELVRASGGTWSEMDGLSLVGLPLMESAGILQSRGGATGTREEIVETLLRSVANQMVSQGIPWRAGAQSLLSQVNAAGIPSALVTMSYPLLTDVMIAQLPPNTFDVVVTGDMVKNGKPHPEPYATAATKLGIDISRSVAIEDSPAGVASAEAAGANVIAVPHLVEIPAAPKRSRIHSLEELNLPLLGVISQGEVIDLFLE